MANIFPSDRHRKCPVCKKHFICPDERLGYICLTCKTQPPKFKIDVHWKGDRCRIYSDKHGQPLDSYSRAQVLRSTIEHEIEHHTFDPSRYVKGDIKKFWVQTLLVDFWRDKEPTIAPSYRRHYKRAIERHREFWSNTDVREIRKADVKKYLAWLTETQDIGAKTIKNTLDHFRAVLRWIKADMELIPTVPGFPSVDVPEPAVTWYSAEEQKTMLELMDPADLPIVIFLMLTGCRPGEARALKVSDVDLAHGTIRISRTFSDNQERDRRKGRGAKPLITSIHPELVDILAKAVSDKTPEAWVFTNPRGQGGPYSEWAFSNIWRRMAKAAGTDRVRGYNATRHSFASQLINQGVTLDAVKELLGHSSAKTTQKYAHLSPETKRKALEKLSLAGERKVIKLRREGQ